jgi:hypothetical protein
MEKAGVFYRHLVFLFQFWYIFLPFGIFYSILVYYPSFWYIVLHFGILSSILIYLHTFWYIFLTLVHILFQEQSGNPEVHYLPHQSLVHQILLQRKKSLKPVYAEATCIDCKHIFGHHVVNYTKTPILC